MHASLNPVSPRTDLRTAFFWIALGGCIVFSSWQMDRMEQQGASLYTAPGLWPGIIGLLLAVLGGVLARRSFVRARATSWTAAEPDDTVLVPASRFRLATAMFFIRVRSRDSLKFSLHKRANGTPINVTSSRCRASSNGQLES